MPGTKTSSSFVPAAPTLPAPKIPSAVPLRRDGNHAEFHAMPTENELPARPHRIAQINSWLYVVAWLNRYEESAVPSSNRIIIRRPP